MRLLPGSKTLEEGRERNAYSVKKKRSKEKNGSPLFQDGMRQTKLLKSIKTTLQKNPALAAQIEIYSQGGLKTNNNQTNYKVT